MTETKPKRRWFRFSLRTLFVVVTIVGVAACWVTYQLNWIRQRHAFLNSSDVLSEAPGFSNEPAIWPLSWFGEPAPRKHFVPFAKIERAQQLFPEAPIMPMFDS